MTTVDESMLPPLPLPPSTVTPSTTPAAAVDMRTRTPPLLTPRTPRLPTFTASSAPRASTQPGPAPMQPTPEPAPSSASLVHEKSLLATRSRSYDDVTPDSASSITPPPYSGPSHFSETNVSTRARESQGPTYYPGLPRLDYKLYSPPNFSLSNDCIVLSSKSDHLSANANALLSLVRTQASIPPKPLIHMKGTRGRKVDFDIKLNLMGLLVPDDTSKRMQYIRCVSEGEMAYRGGVKPDVIPEVGDRELEEWCRRFVEDPAQVKSFALDRVVANMDTMWIEGQLRALLAATQYKGVLQVSFPVTHAKVVVQNQPKTNKFMTSMKKLFSGKHKYEVVQSVWPFATAKSGDEGRRCAVQSEEVWWREWRDPIRYAVSQKRQNGAYVTNEDKLEALMEGKGQDSIDWGGVDAIDMPDEAELEG